MKQSEEQKGQSATKETDIAQTKLEKCQKKVNMQKKQCQKEKKRRKNNIRIEIPLING